AATAARTDSAKRDMAVPKEVPLIDDHSPRASGLSRFLPRRPQLHPFEGRSSSPRTMVETQGPNLRFRSAGELPIPVGGTTLEATRLAWARAAGPCRAHRRRAGRACFGPYALHGEAEGTYPRSAEARCEEESQAHPQGLLHQEGQPR